MPKSKFNRGAKYDIEACNWRVQEKFDPSTCSQKQEIQIFSWVANGGNQVWACVCVRRCRETEAVPTVPTVASCDGCVIKHLIASGEVYFSSPQSSQELDTGVSDSHEIASWLTK